MKLQQVLGLGVCALLLVACGASDRRGNGGTGASAAGVGGIGGTAGFGGTGGFGGTAGFGGTGGFGGTAGFGGTSGFGGTGGVGGTSGAGGTSGVGGTGAVGGNDGGLPEDGGIDGAIGDSGTQADASMADAATDTPPDDNCTAASHAGRGYWFCENNQDWDEARAACQAIGADLVSINDEAEQMFVLEQIDDIGGTQWLIGLNQKNASGMNAGGTWEWVDGTVATFTAWQSSEPDDAECGLTTPDGWEDFSCSNGENWICELP